VRALSGFPGGMWQSVTSPGVGEADGVAEGVAVEVVTGVIDGATEGVC
jgi:hypothetical protein